MKMASHALMLCLLFSGYVLVYLDKTVIGFALLPLRQEFRLGPQQVGYIGGIFFLAYALFQFPAGWLNDRVGYRRMLVLVLVLVLSLSLLGLWALHKMSWHHAYMILALLVLIVAASMMLLLPPPPAAPVATAVVPVSLKSTLRQPLLWQLFITNFLLNVPMYSLVSWLPSFLTQRGLPLSAVGQMMSISGIGSWLTSLVGGSLVGLLNAGGVLGGFVGPIVMGYLVALSHGAYLSGFLFLMIAAVLAGLALLPGSRRAYLSPKHQELS